MFGSKGGSHDGETYGRRQCQTIMLVEAKRDIPWSKPEDIPFDPDKPVPALGGFFPGIFLAAHVRRFGAAHSAPTSPRTSSAC